MECQNQYHRRKPGCHDQNLSAGGGNNQNNQFSLKYKSDHPDQYLKPNHSRLNLNQFPVKCKPGQSDQCLNIYQNHRYPHHLDGEVKQQKHDTHCNQSYMHNYNTNTSLNKVYSDTQDRRPRGKTDQHYQHPNKCKPGQCGQYLSGVHAFRGGGVTVP